MNRLTRNSLITDLPMPIKLQESCGEDACMDVCGQYADNSCIGCPVQECMSRLAAYEDTGLKPEHIDSIVGQLLGYLDAEQAGLLIELPCKVGDSLYIVSSRVDGKGHVRRLTLTHNNMGNILSRLGNDVFATREEAEKVLEASNGE